MNDHHEGPFTPGDIGTRIASGQVASDSYVWAEGMTDWTPMAQLPAFWPVLKRQAAPDSPMITPTLEVVSSPDSEPSLTPRSAGGTNTGIRNTASSAESRTQTGVTKTGVTKTQTGVMQNTASHADSRTNTGITRAAAGGTRTDFTQTASGKTSGGMSRSSAPDTGFVMPTLEPAPGSGDDLVLVEPGYQAPRMEMPVLEESAAEPRFSEPRYAEPTLSAPASGPELSEPYKPERTAARTVSPHGFAPPLEEPVQLEEASSSLSSSSGAPGEEPRPRRKISPVIKVSLAMMLPALIGIGFLGGWFDPILHSPAVSHGLQSVSESLKPRILKLSERFPVLAKWVSPLPALEDVSPEEYEELRAAASAKLETDGPKVAIARSRTEPTAPVFYVASNLPDGTQFDLIVDGIPDTLLNQLSFQVSAKATLQKKLAKTGVVKYPDGKAIPRGQYMLYATETEAQPDATRAVLAPLQASGINLPANLPKGHKLVSTRSYFLGGNKDAVYQERLKAFHDKKKEQATSETTEVKQFASTLEGQAQQTLANFDRLRKAKGAAKAWNDFHSRWMMLQGQLDETFQKWTPDAIRDERFHGVLYQLTQKAGAAIARLHGVQHAFFTTKVDPKSFDIQLGEAASQAQSSLTELKARVEEAEKLPLTPNGLPKKLE